MLALHAVACPTETSMFERFTEKARRALFFSRYEATHLGAAAIEPEHLLLGVLREDTRLSQRYFHGYRTAELIRKEIERHSTGAKRVPTSKILTLSPSSKRVLSLADDESRNSYHPVVTTEHMLVGILRDKESFISKLLYDLGLSLDQIRDHTRSAQAMDREMRQNDYTSVLEQCSRDLTEAAASDQFDPLIGREREIERTVQILCRRTKNNPILIGEPGVGKTAIVQGLAQRIICDQVPSFLKGKRILALDLSLIVAGTKYRGQFEERIKEILSEIIKKRHIIVFIDEIHTLIGAGAAEGSLDAANILKPALARGEIQCIGATTPSEFRKTFEKNRSVERRFQPIRVASPTEEQTIAILEGIKWRYENFHHVRYTQEAIETVVTQSQRYLLDRFLPDKAIDLIDEAGAQVRLRRERNQTGEALATFEDRAGGMSSPRAAGPDDIGAEQHYLVTKDDVEEVLSLWTGIPISSLKEEEKERLLQIEERLHSRVISQDRAISALARAIRRTRAGLKNAGRPIGSFLFLGPTGVGKTEVARTLAEFLFGSERSLICLDMSEYLERHSISKLIGSPPGYVGYEEGGQLIERIRRNPYSVLLLDEIEKAHPDIFNILLQVLEDGVLTDSQGNVADFKNVIVILTSNIGARFIQKQGILGFQTAAGASFSFQEGIMLAVKQTFSPEFINRLDEIIIFDPLTSDDLFEIIGLLVNQMNSRLARSRLRVQVRDEAKHWIIEKTCMDQSYGARPLRRALQKYIEDPLSDSIIRGHFREPGVLEVYVENGALQYSPLKVDELSEVAPSLGDPITAH